jgi:hypothetical protein
LVEVQEMIAKKTPAPAKKQLLKPAKHKKPVAKKEIEKWNLIF